MRLIVFLYPYNFPQIHKHLFILVIFFLFDNAFFFTVSKSSQEKPRRKQLLRQFCLATTVYSQAIYSIIVKVRVFSTIAETSTTSSKYSLSIFTSKVLLNRRLFLTRLNAPGINTKCLYYISFLRYNSLYRALLSLETRLERKVNTLKLISHQIIQQCVGFLNCCSRQLKTRTLITVNSNKKMFFNASPVNSLFV